MLPQLIENTPAAAAETVCYVLAVAFAVLVAWLFADVADLH